MLPFLRKGFVDPEGYWPGVYAIGYTIIYNVRRVSTKDILKRYEDLLNPRWKDNMIMDMEAHDLLADLIDLWGESKATAFHNHIDRKSTRLNSSHITISYAVFCLKKKTNTNLLD